MISGIFARSGAPPTVAFACAWSVYGFDTADSIWKSVPVSSATRLTLNAEFGSIRVQPGNGQSGKEKSVDVEVEFRGYPASRAEFDGMLHDYRLEVAQQGSEVRVSGTFVRGWEPFLSANIFDYL